MLGPFNMGVDKRLELLHAVEYGLELHPVPFLFIVFAKNSFIDRTVVQGAFKMRFYSKQFFPLPSSALGQEKGLWFS